MEDFRDALCEAFSQDSLDQMLRLRLDKNREELVGSGNLRTVVFKLIEVAVREGWYSDLVRAAGSCNSGNRLLQKFIEENANLTGHKEQSIAISIASSRGADRTGSEQRRRSYSQLWEQLEEAHLKIRIENVEQEEFSALLRSVNTYIIRNSAYLEVKDHELAGRYLRLLMEFSELIMAEGEMELKKDWADTTHIPQSALSQASRASAVYEEIESVKGELLGRVRQVLGG